MAVLVDPPPRDNGDGAPTVTAPPSSSSKLAEPPIPGGRVEALMGRLIKVLSHSRLARPLPAVTLSALGLIGVAIVGLCATAPKSSAATPPVLLPLTDVARNLGMPHLPDDVADAIMYVSIVLCCLGLAMMLWANSRGWTPSPRKAFAATVATVAVLVNITPVGSGDVASYAAYGRIAALGHNPYTFLSTQLPGGQHNPYTAIVNPQWRAAPSVYGPVATWTHLLAALIGGARPWLTIWVLMIMAGAAFLATGYVLMRTAANPARAVLLWAANPILIVELVMSGHLDAFLSLVAIAAIVLARRGTTVWHDLVIGLLVGIAGGIKITAAFVALAIAIPLIHDRAWLRLARTAIVAAVTTLGLYAVSSWGFTALAPLRGESKLVISPSVWRLIEMIIQDADGGHLPAVVTTIFGFLWPPLMLALAWYLYNRLSPDVPTVVAATCALTFAWVIVVPWSLPWYTSTAWVALALLPRNTLTRWLTIATGVLALMHFNGGFPGNPRLGPTP
ncbi:MAG TPA: glycosyltransferase family 87 protein [Trebonia sp.]|nr:glycosyltransferase family 87 protein [Trebonia sp.]